MAQLDCFNSIGFAPCTAVTVSAGASINIVQFSPESPPRAPPPTPMMLGFLALVGVSALLVQRTSATPMPDVPELIDGEHRLHARGPPCSQDTPYGRGPNSSTLTG